MHRALTGAKRRGWEPHLRGIAGHDRPFGSNRALHPASEWRAGFRRREHVPLKARQKSVDHGEVELAAERTADQLGLKSDYRETVLFGTGRMASGLAKVNQQTGLLRNGRSACICGRTDPHRRFFLFEGSVTAPVRAVRSCSSTGDA